MTKCSRAMLVAEIAPALFTQVKRGLHAMSSLCVLREIGLRVEHHPTGFALELLNLCECGLPLHHVRLLVLRQLALGAELGSARVTLVLLSESEYHSFTSSVANYLDVPLAV